MHLPVCQKKINGQITQALAASWNASEESFLKGVSWISNLRVRAGWGKSANQAVQPYATLGNLAVTIIILAVLTQPVFM